MRRRIQGRMVWRASVKLQRKHKQPKRLRYAMGLSMVAPNGEVEGPADHAGQAPRAHTVPKRPRRQTVHASRTPPTIVRHRR